MRGGGGGADAKGQSDNLTLDLTLGPTLFQTPEASYLEHNPKR